MKTIQINGGGMMVVELRESFVQIHSATKMQILFFQPSTVVCSLEKENR